MNDPTRPTGGEPSPGAPLGSAARRKALRARANSLPCLATIGKSGLTSAVADQVRSLLQRNPIVKVRLPRGDREQADALATDLAHQSGGELLDRVGFTAILVSRATGDITGLPAPEGGNP